MNLLEHSPAADRDDLVAEETEVEVISDVALRRILIAMGVVGAVAVAAVLFIAAARGALADNDPEPYGNADIGFLQDMIDHHQQALLISNTYLAGNPDGDAAPYAREVIMFQEREIERMDAWLADAGVTRGTPDRNAMAWMGMPTPVAAMPGMQDPANIEQLATATGAAADIMFFEMMSDHHLGGAHMADAAASGAGRSDIRLFAEKMSYNQRIEVVEYDQAMKRLGLTR
jgi:uncharacterized protein (DUF305 family)